VGVSDLDLGSMTMLSTRVSHGLTKLNTKQAAYELVFLVQQTCIYGYGRNSNSHHTGTHHVAILCFSKDKSPELKFL
jgi:hypothetical protein